MEGVNTLEEEVVKERGGGNSLQGRGKRVESPLLDNG